MRRVPDPIPAALLAVGEIVNDPDASVYALRRTGTMMLTALRVAVPALDPVTCSDARGVLVDSDADVEALRRSCSILAQRLEHGD